jgi:hypothetical protein
MVAEYAPPMAPAVARPAMAQVASSAGMVSAGLAPPVVKVGGGHRGGPVQAQPPVSSECQGKQRCGSKDNSRGKCHAHPRITVPWLCGPGL